MNDEDAATETGTQKESAQRSRYPLTGATVLQQHTLDSSIATTSHCEKLLDRSGGIASAGCADASRDVTVRGTTTSTSSTFDTRHDTFTSASISSAQSAGGITILEVANGRRFVSRPLRSGSSSMRQGAATVHSGPPFSRSIPTSCKSARSNSDLGNELRGNISQFSPAAARLLLSEVSPLSRNRASHFPPFSVRGVGGWEQPQDRKVPNNGLLPEEKAFLQRMLAQCSQKQVDNNSARNSGSPRLPSSPTTSPSTMTTVAVAPLLQQLHNRSSMRSSPAPLPSQLSADSTCRPVGSTADSSVKGSPTLRPAPFAQLSGRKTTSFHSSPESGDVVTQLAVASSEQSQAHKQAGGIEWLFDAARRVGDGLTAARPRSPHSAPTFHGSSPPQSRGPVTSPLQTVSPCTFDILDGPSVVMHGPSVSNGLMPFGLSNQSYEARHESMDPASVLIQSLSMPSPSIPCCGPLEYDASGSDAAGLSLSQWEFDQPADLIDEEYLFRRDEMLRRRVPRYLLKVRRLHDLHIVMPISVPHGKITVESPSGANYYSFDESKNAGAAILFGNGTSDSQADSGTSTPPRSQQSSKLESAGTSINGSLDGLSQQSQSQKQQQQKSGQCTAAACDVWASFMHVRLGTIYNIPSEKVAAVCELFINSFDPDLCKYYVPVSMDCRGVYPSIDELISQRVSRTMITKYLKDGPRSIPQERYETRAALTTLNDVRRLKMLRRHLKLFACNLLAQLGNTNTMLGFGGRSGIRPTGGTLEVIEGGRTLFVPDVPQLTVELHDNLRLESLTKGSMKIVVREWSPLKEPKLFKQVWNGQLAAGSVSRGEEPTDFAGELRSRLLEQREFPTARIQLGEIRLEHNHLRMVDPRWPDELILGRRVADGQPDSEAPGPPTSQARFVFCSRIPPPRVEYAYVDAAQKSSAIKLSQASSEVGYPEDVEGIEASEPSNRQRIESNFESNQAEDTDSSGIAPRDICLKSRLHVLYETHLQAYPQAGSARAPASRSSKPRAGLITSNAIRGEESEAFFDPHQQSEVGTGGVAITPERPSALREAAQDAGGSNLENSAEKSVPSAVSSRGGTSTEMDSEERPKLRSLNDLKVLPPDFIPMTTSTSTSKSYTSQSQCENKKKPTSPDSSGLPTLLRQIIDGVVESERLNADRSALKPDQTDIFPLSPVPCRFFSKGGGCARGAGCRFLHPADPMLESKVDVRHVIPQHPKFF